MTVLFRALLIICFLLNLSFNAHSASEGGTFLKVEDAFLFHAQETSNGFAITFDIAPGYYLYKERFKLKPKSPSIQEATLTFSKSGKAKNDPYFGLVHVFHDQLNLSIIVPEKTIGQTLEISYQGCAEAGLCYPPIRKTLTILSPANDNAQKGIAAESISKAATTDNTQAVDISSLDSSDAVFEFLGSTDLLTICAIFFVLGIGLTFTPCVFPMIPIISAVITGQKNPTTVRSFQLAFAYVLGMAITYSAAGVATGLLGAKANLQAAFQNPIFLMAIAGVFVALALSMFGVYEIQLPERIRSKLNERSQSLKGGQFATVFSIGALSALVVSPCVSAPLAGALLYISSTGNAAIGGLSLLALGLGMGVPLIIVAVGGGKFLPKAGLWMERIKNVFGVLLMAIAIWLIGRVVEPSMQMAIWALFFIVIASYLGIFEDAKTGMDKLSKGLGMFIFSIGVLLIVGLGSGSQNILQPLDKLVSNQTALGDGAKIESTNEQSTFHTVYSLEQLEKQIAVASEKQLPVMVDFYADWCISCKVMEKEIFSNRDLETTMKQVYLIKADITENDSQSLELLEHYNLFGPPSLLFHDKSGQEVKDLRVLGEPNLDSFKSRLNKILIQS